MSAQPDSDVTREHVRQLREAGGTYEAIAAAAGVGATTVHAIANSDVRVTPATAEALLAVSPGELPHKRLDAGGTAWRLRSLMAMGHSQERMARALGTHPQTVYKLVSGEKTTAPADIRGAAASLWAAWWDKTPPERTIAERAAAGATRNRARAADWPAPMGLDEDEIDTPGYRPMTHFHRAQGAGVATDPPGRLGAPVREAATRHELPRAQGARVKEEPQMSIRDRTSRLEAAEADMERTSEELDDAWEANGGTKAERMARIGEASYNHGAAQAAWRHEVHDREAVA
jgi:plasmid maintenance system antidote protein VapI